MNDKRLKRTMLLMLVAAGLLLVVFNFAAILSALGVFAGLLQPFVVGAIIALLLNIPLKFIEVRIFDKLVQNKQSKLYRGKRIVSLVLTYLLTLVLVVGVVVLLFPLLASSISSLSKSIPGALEKFVENYNQMILNLGFDPMQSQQFKDIVRQLSEQTMSVIKMALNGLLSATTSIASGMMTGFFAIIISIYFLSTKEKMASSVCRSVSALFNETWSKFLVGVGRMSNDQFSRFIGGQVADSFIFGLVMLVVCALLRVPYTPLVATLVGISNLIPVFGPIIGGAFCALIIMISDPYMALIFLVTDIVLQQIDANVLYPRILGETMGLDGVWILFAVMVFGGLFGFMGILLGIPFVSVALNVWEMFIQEKIKAKELAAGAIAEGAVQSD